MNTCDDSWRHIELLYMMVSSLTVNLTLNMFCKQGNLFDIFKIL